MRPNLTIIDLSMERRRRSFADPWRRFPKTLAMWAAVWLVGALTGVFISVSFLIHHDAPRPMYSGSIICDDDDHLHVTGFYVQNLRINLTSDPCGLFFQNDQTERLARIGIEYGQIAPERP